MRRRMSMQQIDAPMMGRTIGRRIVALGVPVLALAGTASLAGQAPVPVPATDTVLPVNVSVHLDRPLAPMQPIYAFFGYDEGNYTTTALGRQLLGKLHSLSPTPVTIRVHHLLTSGDGTPELKWSSTGVYHEDGDGRPVYDFKLLDGIFDAFHAAGVRPMVELGFMPRDLAATTPGTQQPYQVHFPANPLSGSSNNPPKDYTRWGALAQAVTAHLVERYGRDEVAQWYFEVWNEPDIDYWHGTPEEYWRLYDFAVAGVRRALPSARVGGPASTSPRGAKAYAFLEGFLKHVDTGRSAADGGVVPLDFISFHAKGHPALSGGRVRMGIQTELADADRGFSLVASFPRLRSLPIILSEADPEGCAACSSKDRPANNYRNGPQYPAYTADAYKRLLDLAAAHRVNLVSMLSWSFEFEGKGYFEGFRTLSTNGVDKPILNWFRMAGMLDSTRVVAESSGSTPMARMLGGVVQGACDVDVLATAQGGSASVMLWNYAEDAGSTAAAAVFVTVDGLPADAARVLVSEYRIDTEHSNAYSAWLAMGSPQTPTAEQYSTLQRLGGLQLAASPRWIDALQGRATLAVQLPSQSVSLLRLTWPPTR